MMEEAGFVMGYWGWWILAGVLLLIELLVSGFFFLWMSFAAAAVGFVVYVNPETGWQSQVLIFSALSLVSIVMFRRIQKKFTSQTDQPNLNRRGRQYVGRVFTLEAPIVNGMGSVTVDDSTWRVRGSDAEAGTRVRVSGVDGVILLVEKDK